MNYPQNITLDLDQYTNGDLEFKRKLSDMLVLNLKELYSAMQTSVSLHDASVFQLAYHKYKPAIKLVINPEFGVIIEEIGTELKCNPTVTPQLQALENSFLHWLASIADVVARTQHS